jgi:hypothetical protein
MTSLSQGNFAYDYPIQLSWGTDVSDLIIPTYYMLRAPFRSRIVQWAYVNDSRCSVDDDFIYATAPPHICKQLGQVPHESWMG